MQKYIALLRAINVGKRIIKMSDLRDLFSNLKFENIKTYIQTGNVYFETNIIDKSILETKIEEALYKRFGFTVTTMIIEKYELGEIINSYNNLISDEYKSYVGFLKSFSNEENNKKLLSTNTEIANYNIYKKSVFISLNKEKSKPGYQSPIEKILETECTIRNWNVTNKLLGLFD